MAAYEDKSILNIVDNALCCACGICASACPVNAIRMVRNNANFLLAYVDDKKCIGCRKCMDLCPSICGNVMDLMKSQCEKWDNGKNVIKGFLGYSYNPYIRRKGQSGGVTSSLLMYLVDNGLASGVLVNHFDKTTQQPDVFFANNHEDIISAAGSYYIQTATLKDIDKYGDDVAVVVTGCQCEALMLRYKKTGKRPNLIIGLVCEGTYSLDYMHDLVDFEHTSLNITEYMFKDKRTNGWPGDVYIATDNKVYRKSPSKRVELKPCYASYRCMQCYDMNNIFADIVVGDPWCYRKDCDKAQLKKGYTVVVARTEVGLKAILGARDAGYIFLQEKSAEQFLNFNSYIEGRVDKTKNIVKTCIKNGLPTIYNNCYEKVFNTNFLQMDDSKYKESSILDDIRYAYDLYNADSRSTADSLTYKKKQRLAQKKIRDLPKNLIIGSLVKVRNVFMDAYSYITRG